MTEIPDLITILKNASCTHGNELRHRLRAEPGSPLPYRCCDSQDCTYKEHREDRPYCIAPIKKSVKSQ